MLFDGCSQCTYVTTSLRKQLKLRTLRREKVMIKRFASDEAMLETVDVVQLCAQAKTKNVNIYMEALCVPYICSPVYNSNLESIQTKYSHLKNLRLAETSPPGKIPNIDIQVGLDNYYSLVTEKTLRGKNNSPVAIESMLGWIICGRINDAKPSSTSTFLISTQSRMNYNQRQLESDLHKFWEIETLGVKT